jgi:hypothetical protein
MGKPGESVKATIETLIGFVREETASSGPLTKRAAALAITSFEQGAMWAEKAFTAEDLVEGDDGGIGTGEPPTKEMFDPGDSDP